MIKLYKFRWNYNRLGDVEGIFIEDEDIVNKHIGKEVYFGEILGEHSEVYGTLDQVDLEVISDSQDVIKILKDVFKSNTISGYNPIQYIDNMEDERG